MKSAVESVVHKNSEEIARRLKPVGLKPLPHHPLVSVLIANYNYARYVGEAIESVLSQSYGNLEVIICDDGSTDASCDVISRYVRKDSRVKLLRKENGGQASALNAAYASAQGELICLLDSDDTFDRLKLEKVLAAFSGNPDSGLCVHRLLGVSKLGKPISSPMPRLLYKGWLAPAALKRGGFLPLAFTCTLNFRKAIADQLFPIPAELRFFVDPFLTAQAVFLTPIVTIPDSLALYRLHGEGVAEMTAPSASWMTRQADAFLRIFELQKDFVAKLFGQDVAGRLHLEEDVAYWDSLLAAYILQGKPSNGIRGLSADRIICHLPPSRTRHLWRLMLCLPSPVARRVFLLWRVQSPFRRFLSSRLAPLGERVEA
jgi:glycosyltransferase involved in cell wall biosynthesis